MVGALDLSQRHGTLVWITVAACAVATALAGVRWLRVAQREHYLNEAAGRFALRWWLCSPLNTVLACTAVGSMLASKFWPVVGLASAAAVVVGPVGLTLRGRTSPLSWTRRLRTLAAVWVALEVVVVLLGVLVGSAAPVAALAAVGVPVLVDFACALTAPLETRLAGKYVAAATQRLRAVAPVIVGVTGSYGKTSTKNHIAHLLGAGRAVVASPKSFNNRAGLARAVNEHLAEGTEIFVAEMGTYGPGEIAELCQWCPPLIAVITAIGPVHLERFGSEERIVEAKSEIAGSAATLVLNVDDPHLAALAGRLAAAGPVPRVVHCSASDVTADVEVEREGDGGTVTVRLGGRVVASSVPVVVGVQPTNLACAIAVALALEVPEADITARLSTIPSVPNRLTVATAPSGVVVLDDTFNSNPAGAVVALDALAALDRPPHEGPADDRPVAGGEGASRAVTPGAHRRVVVTPGMVELGKEQARQNRLFAATAALVATDLVVVGRTNRQALLEGAGHLSPVSVRTRDQAVTWVRSRLGPGDAVLYENDLPDTTLDPSTAGSFPA